MDDNSCTTTEVITRKPQPVTLRLYFAIAVVSLSGVNVGGTYGYSAQAIPSMRRDGRFGLVMDSEEENLIGNLATFGGIFGGLLGGWIAGKLGLKKSLHFAAVPSIIGWALIIAAQNLPMIFVGRVITGISVGICVILGPVYISEVSPAHVRGRLNTTLFTLTLGGMLLSAGLGIFINWIYLAVALAIPSTLVILIYFLIPESPYSLLKNERVDEARDSLLWFRTEKYVHLDEEFREIRRDLAQRKEDSEGKSVSFLDLFREPTWEPLLVSLGLMFFQQATGFPCVLFYSTNIFESAGSSLKPEVATFILSLVQCIASLSYSLFMEKMPRRFWLVLSASVMTLSLAGLGAYFKIVEDGPKENLGWLPILTLVSFMVGFSLGYGPLAYSMMAEILSPLETRNMGIAISTAVNSIVSFGAAKLFSIMLVDMKPYGTYWFYAGISLLGIPFALFCVYETRGRTLTEILNHYSRRIKSRPINV